MTETRKLVAEEKFLLAKKFLSELDKYVQLEDNEYDEIFSFLESTYGIEEIKTHLSIDLNKDPKYIETLLNKYSQESFNKNYIKSISNALINSFPSIIKIEKESTNFFLVRDLVLNKEYKIIKSKDQLETGEILFVRIFKIDGYCFIISFFNTLEYFQVELLLTSIESFFKEYRKAKSIFFLNDSSKEFILKNRLIDIFLIFSINFSNFLEENEDISFDHYKSAIINKMFSFEDAIIFNKFLNYTLIKENSSSDIVLHYFLIIYESSLKKLNFNFSDYKSFNFLDLFSNISSNGDFFTDEELKDTIKYIIDYYYFANNYIRKFDKAINELNEVYNNILFYKYNLRNSIKGFFFDSNLLDIVDENSDFDFNFNFLHFIDFLNSNSISKSTVSNKLTDSSVKIIAKSLNLEVSKEVKNPNQTHYPLINFFYNFIIIKDIVDEELNFTDNFYKFMSLESNEQITIFIHYLFKEKFLNVFLSKTRINKIYSEIKELFKLKNLKFKIESLELGEYSFIINFLIDLSFINKDESSNYYFTDFGKNILNYYIKSDTPNNIVDFKK
ncbi:MAG: hypothetical protein ACTHWZ_04280 [Peptoniphilaceae bacterium]